MNVDEKLTLIMAIEQSGFTISEALKRLDIPRTTYYRWRSKMKHKGPSGLIDKRPVPKNQWNALTPREEETILEVAHEFPELSSREISFHITDSKDFSVSESTVYRLLKDMDILEKQKLKAFRPLRNITPSLNM